MMVNIPKLDSHLQIVGETTIPEARENGWPRMIARVFVKGTDGRILLQRRSDDGPIFPGLWDLAAAGHVDVGENYETAAAREMKEEIGITAPLTRVIEGMRTITETDNVVSNVYTALVPPDTNFDFDLKEVAEVKWVTVAELDTLVRNEPEQCMFEFVRMWRLYRDTLIP